MQGGSQEKDPPKIVQVLDCEIEAALLKFVAAAETSLVERLPRLSEHARITTELVSPRFGVTWDMLRDHAESAFPGISIGSLLRRGDLTLWSSPDQLGGVMRHVPPSLRDALESSICQWISGELPNGDPGTVAEAVLGLLDAHYIEVRDWLPEPAVPAGPVGPVFRLPPPSSTTAAARSTHEREQRDNERPAKRGRPYGTTQSDEKEDRRLADAWKHGQFRSYEAGALKLGVAENKLRKAVDRDRQRHRRK